MAMQVEVQLLRAPSTVAVGTAADTQAADIWPVAVADSMVAVVAASTVVVVAASMVVADTVKA